MILNTTMIIQSTLNWTVHAQDNHANAAGKADTEQKSEILRIFTKRISYTAHIRERSITMHLWRDSCRGGVLFVQNFQIRIWLTLFHVYLSWNAIVCGFCLIWAFVWAPFVWKAHGMGMWGQCRYEIGYQWPQRVICDVMNRSLRVVDLVRFICIMLIDGSYLVCGGIW